jgi:hypothetical protein
MQPPREKTEKDVLATAFISNCGAAGRKEVLSQLMASGVKVDSFGACMNNRREGDISQVSDKYARKIDIMSRYKFHLAFENSETQDYITEKFFLALQAGTVPVHFGASNIHDFEPAPNSIFYVGGFSSPVELGKRMKEIAANETRYAEMLAWKHRGMSESFRALVDLNLVHSKCRLCLKIADVYAASYGIANDGLIPEHQHLPRDTAHFHLLVPSATSFIIVWYTLPRRPWRACIQPLWPPSRATSRWLPVTLSFVNSARTTDNFTFTASSPPA